MGIYLVRAKEINCLKCDSNRLFLVKANTKIESIKMIVNKLNTNLDPKYKKYCQTEFTSVRVDNRSDEDNGYLYNRLKLYKR